MYELSVSYRYLLPRLREISVSIISLISVLVIALVVWLIIVFFSATEGLEKRWTERLVAITGPIRLTPNDAYFSSYYYLIDSASHASHYQLKSIHEKLNSTSADPYDSLQDPPLSTAFPKKELASDGKALDILQIAYRAISAIPGVRCSPFETAFANAKIQVTRNVKGNAGTIQELITQPSYVVTWDEGNNRLEESILPLSRDDIANIAHAGLHAAAFTYPFSSLFTDKDTQRLGDPVLLPKGFMEAGVAVADTGMLHYQAATATGIQDLKAPIFVAGFYDPGIIPIGGKIILAPEALVSELRGTNYADEQLLPSGLNVYFSDLKRAYSIKKTIIEKLEKASVAKYFDIQAYDEYDFTKDIFTQLKSERNLFSLISIIIIIVACSNIVSMLIIMVHDKTREIAILRALGATKKSIALIFGLSGLFMGAAGSLIGCISAYCTVKNLPLLLKGLGKLQGFDVLNTNFYGDQIPTEISYSILLSVIIITGIISMVAALVPAVKASRQNTQDALRSE